MSTAVRRERREEARKAGATGWIVKPFRPGIVLRVVRTLLGPSAGRARDGDGRGPAAPRRGARGDRAEPARRHRRGRGVARPRPRHAARQPDEPRRAAPPGGHDRAARLRRRRLCRHRRAHLRPRDHAALPRAADHGLPVPRSPAAAHRARARRARALPAEPPRPASSPGRCSGSSCSTRSAW